LATAPGSTLDEVGRHFHIEAYINSGDLHRTQQLIHSYENRNMAPALRTYNSFISSLLAQKRSDSRALAWDMYAHMRYVAHPTPDSAIYTTMIRGCTMSGASESHAERALDLWTEMTVDNRIAPTQASYNAIILACAKNSKFTHEAFRLAKEMMDAYRDGALHLRPDRNTFRALLENAKRASDLSRARWIFAELLKAEQDESLVPDHDIISLVFQVYACYKPPFRRQALLVQDRQGETPDYNGSASSHDVEDHSDAPAQQPSLSVPPQTHSEVIAEVEALFSRIVSQSAQSGAGTHSEPLSKVQLTTQLLNSYLTVHYAHSTLRTSLELFHRLFDDLEVRRNLWSFIHVMERCSYSQTVEERRLALKVVDVIWREWDAWINELVPSPEKMVARATTIPPRLVERVWRAKIRTLAL
jgi:pentatricopeptide repeat protein